MQDIADQYEYNFFAWMQEQANLIKHKAFKNLL